MMFKARVWLVYSSLILLFAVTSGYTQVVGDYQTAGTGGNWNAVGSWVRWNGAAFVAPGAFGYPGEFANPNLVTILSEDDVVLNVPVTITNLTIEGGTLFNSTTLTTTGNPTLTMLGGLIQGFSGGGVFPLSSFTFSGTGSLSIGGNATVGGQSTLGPATFTFSSSGTMTVTGNASVTLGSDFIVSGGTYTMGGSLSGTADGDITFSNPGNVTIGGTTTLTPTTSSLTDSNNTGISTFAGLVTLDGTWTSTAVTTPANMIFNGGINCTNSAPGLNGGGATFNTNNQSLSGNGNISFVNNVAITAITLDNTNTGTVTFGGTGTTTTLSTSGGFTDSNNNGLTIFAGNVLVGAATSFVSTAVTSTGNMIFRGGIANSNVFTAGGATFNTNAQAITGASSLSFANNVAITGVTVTNSNTANLTISGTTTLGTSGGFTDSDNTGITTLVGNVSVGAGTSFISTAVTTTANLVFRGGIANANTFTAGGATFNTNSQAITGASSLSFANNVAITGVTVTNSNTANLTISGTTTLATSGGFTDSDNTGITTLVGNVSVGAGTSFISTAVTTTANLVFRGGIANANTFTAGGATFNTNSQAITGASSLSFANNVAITGVTVTNSNTANLTISGTTTLATSGGFTDSDNTGITTLVGNVSVGAGTSFISTAVTTTGNLVFRGGIANANTFTAGGATFNTNSQAITGASSLSFANNVAITGVTVTNSNTANLTISGTTTLATSGGFTDSDNTGITTLVGNVSVGAGTSFISTAVTTTGNLVFRGGIANANTFTAGGATFNTNPQTLTGAGTMTFAQIVTVIGIAVTNNGTVSLTNTSAGTLAGTGTWTQGTGTLNFAGSTLTVNIFDASTVGNTVNYNSSLAQTIRVPSTTYYNLTFNNSFATSPQLTAGGNLSVSNIITMTDGNVDLNGNTFTLTSTSGTALSHSLASTAGWMYGGNFNRAFPATAITIATAAGLIPIGSAVNFRPFFFDKDNIGGSSGTITISHTDPGTVSSSVTVNDGGTNIIIRNNSSWGSTMTGGTGATFRIRYGGTGLGIVTDLTHLRSMLFNSVIATHVTATTVSLTDPRVERSTLSLAQMTNTFYMGSTSSSSPLPIELLDFNATLRSDEVELAWITSSELNNDFFTVERAADVEKFEEVVTIKGQGTINTKTKYTSVDDSPLPGKSYYRLKQTDFDGKFTYSELKKIEYTDIKTQFRIYPNPVSDSKFNFELTGADPDVEVPVRIVSLQGVTVFEQSYKSDKSGRIKTMVELNQISSGMYLVIVNTVTGLRKKILIQ